MSRRIETCTLELREGGVWSAVTTLSDAEWTGFAPAGCGVDQGRVIATPAESDHPAFDPDAPDRTFRLVSPAGEPLFEFLGYVDDRRPRRKGAIILGISTTPELLGGWVQELAGASGD